jgi:hypothetical protein
MSEPKIVQVLEAPENLFMLYRGGHRERVRLLALVQSPGGKTTVEALELTQDGFELVSSNPDFQGIYSPEDGIQSSKEDSDI